MPFDLRGPEQFSLNRIT